jgi:ABC-2 type transport system permease protein
MHNIWLIARREYFERIKTRGFIITTILIPLLMGGGIFGSAYLNSRARSTARIAVVSADARLVLDLQAQLHQDLQPQHSAARGDNSQATHLTHITVEAMNPDAGNEASTRASLDRELESGALDGYLWISASNGTPGARPAFTWTPRSSGDTTIRNLLSSALRTVFTREQLAHRGIVGADFDSMNSPVAIATARAPRRADTASAEVSVLILFFLMYMVIILYGMNVARSIIEEKTSRIFEVMLATVRPGEMMAGKIIGVGSVGLTQVAIWLAVGLFLANTTMAASFAGQSIHVALSASQVAFFFVYFILGYLFYSSIAAALGAMTNSEQELQQLNMFLMLPLITCGIVLTSVMSAPDGRFARVLALIPPFTPLLMYIRISLGHPYLWEKVVSIALTSFCIYLIVWITSRIYRVGVLMYGKRPTLPEILRWLKYS